MTENLVEEGHPLHATLRQELNALCARFGKSPNALARISIIPGPNKQPPAVSDDLVALLAAVFKSLSPAQKTAFRKLTLPVKAHWRRHAALLAAPRGLSAAPAEWDLFSSYYLGSSPGFAGVAVAV